MRGVEWARALVCERARLSMCACVRGVRVRVSVCVTMSEGVWLCLSVRAHGGLGVFVCSY